MFSIRPTSLDDTLIYPRQDYYATPYLAEIVNTLTNIVFLWFGIKGIISCRQNHHDGIFLVTFIGYVVVGLGSSLFHASLRCKAPTYKQQKPNPPPFGLGRMTELISKHARPGRSDAARR